MFVYVANSLMKSFVSETSFSAMSQSAQSTNGNQSQSKLGLDKSLFNRPSTIFEGPDAPYPFGQGPLFRDGTDSRIAFDETHAVTIAVVFKIHTNSADNLAAPIPPKVSNGRRYSAPAKVPLVDSKTFNNGDPIELKACPYGKSLNNMKKLCAKVCEEYAPLMEQLLLTSPLAPVVEWKGVVGQTKVILDSHHGWFEFADLMLKAKKKKFSIMILDNNKVMKAQKKAQESAAKQLIATAAGPAPVEQEIEVVKAHLEEAEKLVKLHKTTAAIYHQHAKQSNGGDGVVLEQKLATIHMAPDTQEYRAKMAKLRVFHRLMRVEDRVKQRIAACWAARSSQSFFGKAHKDSNSPTPRGGQANCLVILSSDPDPHVKTVTEQKARKEIDATPTVAKPDLDVKPNLRASRLGMPIQEVKPNLLVPHYATSGAKGNTIVLDKSDSLDTSNGIDSVAEGIDSHKAALENFLYSSGVAPEDVNTRFGLAEAGVECWQDLVPSLQMTEGTLTVRGVDHEIAGQLLARAQAQHWRTLDRDSPRPSPQKKSTRGPGNVEVSQVLYPKNLGVNPFL
ncbi:hypothetical protein DFH28DRAFT_1123621 [Melampsora americana]|nr:hypothetical protein DFH28DRAFT_1123621 [Melampsora americana]